MSSAVISTSAATGRPFIFGDNADAEAHPLSTPCNLMWGQPPSAVWSSEARQPGAFPSTINHQQSTISPTGNRKSEIGNSFLVTPASHLEIRPAPEMVSSGIPALDTLTGGLPRGCLTEICGPASSGRTTVLLAALAAATRRGEFCAVVDASDALDPQSVAAAGVQLGRLLWVRCGAVNSPQRPPSTSLRAGSGTEKQGNQKEGRPISRASSAREACPELAEWVRVSSQSAFNFDGAKSRAPEHRLEQVLRTADLLLESGGFGLIALDLGDVPPQAARRIPLTTWFRFRRAVEYKPTILLALEQQPIAGSCASLLLQLSVPSSQFSEEKPSSHPAHTQLLTGLKINTELIRSRLERKPIRGITFATKTAWAG